MDPGEKEELDRLTQQDYAEALRKLGPLKPKEVQFLQELSKRPGHAATAEEMATALGLERDAGR
jgi:DNA-binding MarR family transcriptional regulator